MTKRVASYDIDPVTFEEKEKNRQLLIKNGFEVLTDKVKQENLEN